MKVFYGPPGTGKTYRAAREAVRIIDGQVDADPETAAHRHRELVRGGRIWWVTFHPSYSYEDFVEGFRPVPVGGSMQYRVVDGPFKRVCGLSRAPGTVSFRVGETLMGPGRGTAYTVVRIEPGGLVVTSRNRKAKAAGRTTTTLHNYVDFWTIDRLRSRNLSPDEITIPGKDPGSKQKRQDLGDQAEMTAAFFGNSSPHAAVYRAIVRKEAEARGAVEHPTVLVIDEINRADLARVFGELFTLLEGDKREGGREEARVILPYSREPFTVPMNVHIIGTMNTADRSLSVMDVALRRRFRFEEVPPDPERCAPYGGADLAVLLRDWNERITVLRDREHRIGHSELMHGRLETVRRGEGWPDDSAGQMRALALTLRQTVLPLLLEYFPDSWRKAHTVLGAGGLLEEHRSPRVAELLERELDFDLSDATGFVLPAWWDPHAPAWDAARFLNALQPRAGGVLASAPVPTAAAHLPAGSTTALTPAAAPAPNAGIRHSGGADLSSAG